MTLLAAAAIPASIQTSAALAATDTVANGGDSGAGSLRSVIASASSGDTIRFASRVHTVTVSSPIHINKNLTIDGAAGGIPTIDGGNRSRIFTIIGGHVSIFGLTLTRGKDPLAGGAIDDTSPGSLSVLSSMFVNNAAGAAELTQRIGGGAIFYGGSGRLSVDDSTFTGNTAGGPDPDLTGGLLGGSGDRGFSGFGGAIAINPTSASASINGSTFTHDAAGGPSDCPGGNGYGGAIFFYGNGAVTVRGDRFDGDTAGGRGCPDAGGDSGFGGAIWEGNTPLIIANSEEDHPNTSGSLSVSSSTFHQNHAGGHGSGAQTGHGRGGAIGVYANGPISVSTSTFNGNGAGGPAGGFGSTNSGEGEGGAIWQLGGTLSTSNSTLTRNSAGGTSAAGQGGAIFALIPTTLASDTIDANAVGSEDIFGAPNAGSGIDARPVTAIATIISGNTGTTNCAERVASSKYSFEGPAGSTTCGLDLPSVDPGLRALADNGGPTQTQALPPTGPAVDRVPVSICPAHSDQRGLPRPDGRETMCDVGAYEHRDPKAVPAMTTSPPASAVRTGHALHDTARLTGGNAPTGTVTFKLYASARCSGDPVFTSTNRVARLATSSGNFRPRRTATYEWTAHYNGDDANTTVMSSCGAETVRVVADPPPSISTTPSTSSTTVGRRIHDTATVTAGTAGHVTFTLYGSRKCSGHGLASSTKAIAAAGKRGTASVSSSVYTPTVAGTYEWVATYRSTNGFTRLHSSCGAEPVTVGPAHPAISTKPVASAVALGHSLRDTALVSGGRRPSGLVRFELFATHDCSGSPVFTSTVSMTIAMSPSSPGAESGPFTATRAGTYQWVAVYGGDRANASATSPCGSETVTVQPPPSLSTKPVANSVTVGQPVQDTAHVSGGLNPTGNVTFELFSSKDCSGAPVFTSTNPLGNEPGSDAHSSQSDPYTTTAAGDYQWVAVYNGDAGNPSATSRCGAEPVTVNRAQPTISTKVVESSVVIGNTVQDGATISGGKSPTGDVSFALFDTQDCSGSPVFTTTDPLTSKQGSSSGTTESDPFAPLKTGAYQWVATYTGDGANASVSSPCGSEAIIVTPQ